MAHTMQELVDEVTASRTIVDGFIVIYKDLKAKIDAIPGITPEMQAMIDAAFDGVKANEDAIAAALVTNTPPVVTPPVIPPVVEPPVV